MMRADPNWQWTEQVYSAGFSHASLALSVLFVQSIGNTSIADSADMRAVDIEMEKPKADSQVSIVHINGSKPTSQPAHAPGIGVESQPR